jgi:CelD/BcsL family acetyltransferase involved in cellulose biosynthesis
LFVYGTAGERVVAPLGVGISDYLDLLVDRALEREALDAIFTMLAENHRRWSRVDLEALRPVSPVLRAPLPAGYEDEVEALDVCPVLTVPLGDLRSVVRSRQLSHFRKARRDLEKAGAVRIEVANEQTREELLEALLRLHAARWTALGSTGVLADPSVQRFHREVSAGLLARGVLRLYALRVDRRIVGSVYTFLEKDVAYFYLQGFDPEFQWFSPGMQVVGHAIEEAVRRGARSCDFLRGAEAYKYAWGATDQPTFRRRIHNRTWQPA